MVKVIDAHVGSVKGVSNMLKLKNPGPLITRGCTDETTQFLVTTAFDKPEFKIWQYLPTNSTRKEEKNGEELALLPHVMITTSLTDGIHFVLQSSAD
jgi:hypothetical protein